MRRLRHAVAVTLLLAAGGLASGGGNTQFRNPSNPTQVFNKLWDDRRSPIPWVMSSDGLPGSGISNAALVAELTAAFDAWEGIATSRLDFRYDGEVPYQGTGLDGPFGPGIDGRNLVTFTDPDLVFPPGVLAVAITTAFPQDTVITAANSDLDGDGTPDLPEGTYPAGRIFDGDIAFNSSKPWATGGAFGTIDVRAVALHEIGHFFGLAHSMVRDAVMWPFLSPDIGAARTLKVDDVAYASHYYPSEPAYSSTFGSIQGRVVDGFSNTTVLGAHVYASNPADGTVRVGGYTGDDGRYTLPGLVPGSYVVSIEPLDGDPPGLDPYRVNEVIQYTFDTGFPEESHDADESNVEADPAAATPVAVTAGASVADVDFVTNTVVLPGASVILEAGYNLFAFPVAVPSGLRAFDLLQALGTESEVRALQRYDRAAGTYERAQYVDGVPGGANFPIRRGEGYVVHMAAPKVVSFSGPTDCPELELSRGLNLIGVPCPPAGYGAFRLLEDVGARFEVGSIRRFDPDTGTFPSAQYDPSDNPVGTDYAVRIGEGYVVEMLADKAGVALPAPGSRFAPVLTGLAPGRGVPGTTVLILGEGFDPDPAKDVVTFGGIGASVVYATSTSLTVTVPASAASGLVRVSVAGMQSNAIAFEVLAPAIAEAPGGPTPIASGQVADGTLLADGEQDRYTFTALAGSLVTATATALTPGVPDLVLLLEDPYGVVVETDDNGGGGTDARLNNVALATTGLHTLVVSNVPGSGLGAYRVALTITPRSSVPQVSILDGNFQTGLQGSALPTPLSVLVTGASGMPVTGSQVTFVATETSFGGSSVGPTNAGTTVQSTNASGIVQVAATLPSSTGMYTITVTTPGVPVPATFTIAATDKPVATVETTGNLQQGTVNRPLANPFAVVLKDSLGGFVGNALVAFRVVSGGGTISGPACPNQPGSVCYLTSVADGRAATTLTLGRRIDVPQIVAAFVPGRPPVFFEATPLADVPAKVESNRTNFNRMTLGTSVLSAIQVQVYDQFGNPVKNATVVHTPSGGLTVGPGIGPNGEVFTTNLTNAEGLHVASLSAAQGAVLPTIDEFGNRIASLYAVGATVNGIAANFVVDVDMGPDMVTFSGQNVSGLYGRPLASPVTKFVLRWERRDTFIDANNDQIDDDDNGDFRDEDFLQLDQVGVSGATILLEARREDGRDEQAAGYTPITLGASQIVTAGNGLASVNVTHLGDIGGVKYVIGRIDQILVEWRFDDGSLIDSKAFVDDDRFGERTNLIAVPVVIRVDLDDADSGIDFATVVAKLNGTAFFDAAAPPAVLPGFPETLEVIVGGTPLRGLDAALVDQSAFRQIRIVYYPAATRLGGSNTVEVQSAKDNAENPEPVKTLNFSFP